MFLTDKLDILEALKTKKASDVATQFDRNSNSPNPCPVDILKAMHMLKRIGFSFLPARSPIASERQDFFKLTMNGDFDQNEVDSYGYGRSRNTDRSVRSLRLDVERFGCIFGY